MAEVTDVAKSILAIKEPITSMKLQKLAFYAQAYSLVYNQAPLFHNRIEAWINGPVIPDLYNKHRGKFLLWQKDLSGECNSQPLAQEESQSISTVVKIVVEKLGDLSGESLRELSHAEAPWQNARIGLEPEDRGSREITPQEILNYYKVRPQSNPLFQ